MSFLGQDRDRRPLESVFTLALVFVLLTFSVGCSPVENPRAGSSPSLAVLDNQLYAAYLSPDGSDRIHIARFELSPELKFIDRQRLSTATTVPPALAARDGKLWLAYVGRAKQQIHVRSLVGGEWSRAERLGFRTRTSPALTAFEAGLLMAWRHGETTELRWSSFDGRAWSPGRAIRTPFRSRLSPSLAGGQEVTLAYVPTGKSSVELIRFNQRERRWRADRRQAQPGGSATNLAPSLVLSGPLDERALWLATVGRGDCGRISVSYLADPAADWKSTRAPGARSCGRASLAALDGRVYVGFLERSRVRIQEGPCRIHR
jgi:hypothetical protein